LEPRANDLTLESPSKSVYKLLKSGRLQMERVARSRLDKLANSYFLGFNEKSVIERTSSDRGLICSGQHLITEVGIHKERNNLFKKWKEMLMGTRKLSSKRSSSRCGQPDRKLLRPYSMPSSKIEYITVSWRWRIFSDGKYTWKEELSVGWILPRNFKTTSDSHVESLSGNKIFSWRNRSKSSFWTLRSNAFETHMCTSCGWQPLSLSSLSFLIFSVRLRRAKFTNAFETHMCTSCCWQPFSLSSLSFFIISLRLKTSRFKDWNLSLDNTGSEISGNWKWRLGILVQIDSHLVDRTHVL